MADNQTVVVVGTTETDEYGNLWVTPKGGGERIKIAAKRSGLHPIFEQGKAIMLKWQTYQEHPYVADAKPVAGELQPPTDATMLAEHEKVIEEARAEAVSAPVVPPPNPQAVGMFTKEIGDMIRSKYLVPIWGEEAAGELIKWYRGQGLGITRIPFDGDKLPKFGVKPEKGE